MERIAPTGTAGRHRLARVGAPAPSAEQAAPAGLVAPNSTEAYLRRSSLRYAASGRAVVGIVVAVIAPFAGPPIGVAGSVAVSAGLIAWSLYYGRSMHRDARTWVWVADIGILSALCLAQPLLVDPQLTLTLGGWISPLASFALVALQWHVRLRPAAIAAVVVAAALVAGASLAPEIGLGQALMTGGLWALAEAGLSRLLWVLVQRGGRIADEILDARFAQERTAELARARRAAQRVHWATIHDTAASTLQMVGLGEVHGHEPWLLDQVRRDLDALDGRPVGTDGSDDLGAVLVTVVGRARVSVQLDTDENVQVPPVVVAAVGGSVGEALENVRRHAGTGAATVSMRRTAGDGVVVRVRDEGRGFSPTDIPPSRHGLALSVRDRMARAGGRATVSSAPGMGTSVELEWPNG